jgi:ABC-type transport system substrate-binding protein
MAAYAPTRHPWTVPGRLRIATSYSVRTLNPLLATTSADESFSRLFSDTLITEDAHGRLVPDLAAEIPTTENGGISAETYDRSKRKAAYARIERIVEDKAPMDFLWWPENIEAVNPDLRGFEPNPVIQTWNAWQWSI